jgi:hypothetical protein
LFDMSSQDSQKDSSEAQYLSKRVLVNGQFVTLYSSNGQTWLSSPEEIPELMARLDNARIMLASGEKPEVAEGAKPQKTDGAAEQPVPAKLASNKYRMKGPKPRPILRQGGAVIMGTPVEPISASSTVVTMSPSEESDSKPVVGSKAAGGAKAKAAPTAVAKGKGMPAAKVNAAPVGKAAKSPSSKVAPVKAVKPSAAVKPAPVAAAKKVAAKATVQTKAAPVAKQAQSKAKAKPQPKAAAKKTATKKTAPVKKKASQPQKGKATRR